MAERKYPQGVSFDKATGKFLVRIRDDGKLRYVARTTTVEEAEKRYAAASAELFDRATGTPPEVEAPSESEWTTRDNATPVEDLKNAAQLFDASPDTTEKSPWQSAPEYPKGA